MKELQKLESKFQKKDLKSEITCFKITKGRKNQLKQIRQFYGKSYGFIVNDLIGRVYEAMLNDTDTSLLKDASKLNDISKESLKVIKIGNKEGEALIRRMVKKLDETLSELKEFESKLISKEANLIKASSDIENQLDVLLELNQNFRNELLAFEEQSKSIVQKKEMPIEAVIGMVKEYISKSISISKLIANQKELELAI